MQTAISRTDASNTSKQVQTAISRTDASNTSKQVQTAISRTDASIIPANSCKQTFQKQTLIATTNLVCAGCFV